MKHSKVIIISAMVAAIVSCVVVLQIYKLRTIAALQDDVYVLTDARIAKDLTRGLSSRATEEDGHYPLRFVSDGEMVYARGSNVYVGEDMTAVAPAFPFFANDGTALLVYGAEPSLVDDSFDALDTFTGMYVSDGQTFNYDKSAAGDEPVLFMRLSNGLFLNAQPISFDYPGGANDIRLNSIFYFGEDDIRYAARDVSGKEMALNELPTVSNVTVRIGGQTLSYEQLRMALGLVSDVDMKNLPIKTDEPKPEIPKEDGTAESIPHSDNMLAYNDDLSPAEIAQLQAEAKKQRQLELEEHRKQEQQAQLLKQQEAKARQAAAAVIEAQKLAEQTASKEAQREVERAERELQRLEASNQRKEQYRQDADAKKQEALTKQQEQEKRQQEQQAAQQTVQQGSVGSGDSAGKESGAGEESAGDAGDSSDADKEDTGADDTDAGDSDDDDTAGDEDADDADTDDTGAGDANDGDTDTGDADTDDTGSGDTDSGDSGTGDAGAGDASGGDKAPGASGGTGSLGSGTDSDAAGGEDSDDTDDTDDTAGGDAGDDETDKPERPILTFGDFSTGVYSLDTSLQIDDETESFYKATIEIYWQPEDADKQPAPYSDDKSLYQLRFVRTVRSAGDIHIDNLPSDTYMYVKGYYYWTEDKEKYLFYEGEVSTMDSTLHTNDLWHVDDIYVDFNESSQAGERLEPNQIKIFDLSLSGPNPNILAKVGRIDILAQRRGSNSDTHKFSISASSIASMYTYKAGTWTSEQRTVLISNTQYDYELKVYDTYGSLMKRVARGSCPADPVDFSSGELLLCEPRYADTGLYAAESFTGSARTARIAPRAVITQGQFTDKRLDIDRGAFNIKIIDADNARTGHEGDYVLRIYDSGDAMRTRPVSFATAPGAGTVTELALNTYAGIFGDVSSAPVTIPVYGLTAGGSYVLELYGSYELNDNGPLIKNALIESRAFSTVPLSRYGQVSYDLKATNTLADPADTYESATAQDISITIRQETQYDLLNGYPISIDIDISTGGLTLLSGTLTSDELRNINIVKTGSNKTGQREIALNKSFKVNSSKAPLLYLSYNDGAAGTASIWDEFISPGSGACLILSYPDGALMPVTTYTVSLTTSAVQNGTRHDVTSSSDSFRKISFTTMKRLPKLQYSDILIASDYIEILKADMGDIDRVILDGAVTASVVPADGGAARTVKYTADYTAQGSDGYIDIIRAGELTKGTKYVLSIYANRVVRDSAHIYNNYLLAEPYTFTAGDGLNGELVYEGIKRPVNAQGEEDLESFIGKLTINVRDNMNNLIGSPEITLEGYEDGQKLSSSHFLGTLKPALTLVKDATGKVVSTNDYTQTISFDCVAGSTYQFVLSVMYNGNKIVLDEMSFDANRTTEVIHNKQEFKDKLAANPKGDFIVLCDIEMDPLEKVFAADTDFWGTIDFKGHTFSVKTNKRSGTDNYVPFNATLRASAKISNLVIDFLLDPKNRGYGNTGFARTNYGNISDIIVNMNLGQGSYRHSYVSGICKENYGTIERFAVYFAGQSTNAWGDRCAGVCNSDSGIVRDGVIYTPKPLNVTTGIYALGYDANPYYAYSPGYNDSTAMAVCEVSPAGTLENVFTVGDLYVERAYQTAAGTTSHLTNAMLAAQASGSNGVVRNCFSVGDIYDTVWKPQSGSYIQDSSPYTEYGTALSAGFMKGGSSKVKNNFYMSRNSINYAYDTNPAYAGICERVQGLELLKDISFYNQTVNKNGSFNLTDIANGYYPRVLMHGDVYSKQQFIPLDLGDIDASKVQYQTCEIIEQHERGDASGATEDYAIAKLTFTNRLGRQITGITLEGLTVTPESPKLTTYRQERDGDLYRVYVKLTPDGTRYSDRYSLTKITYQVGSGSSTVIPAVGTSAIASVAVTFYMPLNQGNWLTADTTAKDGYYKLETDIDLSRMTSADRQTAIGKFYCSDATFPFTGVINGKGHSLIGFELGNQPSLFNYVRGATITDLTVRGLKIDVSGAADNIGLIGQATDMSILSDITVIDAMYTGITGNAGALAGSVTGCSVTDCVAAGCKLTTAPAAQGMAVGGLIGRSESTQVDNCLARLLRIDARSGRNSNGTGGLIGVSSATDAVNNAYAQGHIDSGFMYTGGAFGKCLGKISSLWTNVGIVSTQGYVGGIAGQLGTSASMTQVLAVGEVFTSAVNFYNRISGNGVGKNTMRICAYDSQPINAQVDPTRHYDDEAQGVPILLSALQLQKSAYYWERVNLGYAFDYTFVNSHDKGMPRLNHKDTGRGLLPCQETALIYAASNIEFDADGTATWDDTKESYDLTVTVTVRGDDLDAATLAGYISIDGISIDAAPAYTTDTPALCVLTYTALTPQKYVDSYRIVYSDGVSESGQKLEFSDGTATVPLYYHIKRATRKYQGTVDLCSWQDAVDAAGYSYENFLIMNDIDFTGITDIKTGLAFNRLEGNIATSPVDVNADESVQQAYLMSVPGGFPKLHNLTYNTSPSDDSNSWINTVSTNIEYLQFDNISWSNGKGGDGFGLIKNTACKVRFIDFTGITLNLGNGVVNNAGCIASSDEDLSYMRLRDIKLTAVGKCTAVGGLCGYVTKSITHISATGSGITKSGTLDAASWNTAAATYFINLKGAALQCGAVAGQIGKIGVNNVSGACYVYIDNVYLSARNYNSKNIGGLAGSVTDSYMKTSLTDSAGGYVQALEIKNSCIESGNGGRTGGLYGIQEAKGGSGLYAVLIDSCKITGGGAYTGGFAGTGAIAYPCITQDSYIRGSNSYVGGVSGQIGEVSSSRVIGTYIEGLDSVGGVAGDRGSHGTCVMVQGCRVKGRNHVGGVCGSANGRSLYNDSVTDTEVSGTSNVGGHTGYSERSMVKSVYVDDSVTVKGETNVGGYAGRCIGGYHSYIETGASVTGNTAVGGLAGNITGAVAQSGYNLANIYNCIVAGKVTANTGYAGALCGQFAPGTPQKDSKGNPIAGYYDHMHSSHFYQILLACTSVTANTTGNAYLLGQGAIKNGVENKASLSDAVNVLVLHNGMKIGGQTVTARYTDITDNWAKVSSQSQIPVKLASLTTLKNYLLYTAAKSEGGLKFLTDDYNIFSALANNKFPIYILSKFNWVGDRQNPPTIDGIPLPGPTVSPAPPRINPDSILNAVRIYTVDADAINIDLPEAALRASAGCTIEVLGPDGTPVLPAMHVTERSYTLDYDFVSGGTLVITAYGRSKSLAISAVDMRRSVMVLGNACYYIRSDGIVRADAGGTSLILPGSYIHLYRGYALASNGTVTDVQTQQVAKTAAAGCFNLRDTAKALYTTEYLGQSIDCYRTYSVSGSTVSPYRLIARNGKLMSIDPATDESMGLYYDGFIADYYEAGSSAYLSMLTNNHTITDTQTALAWPLNDDGEPAVRDYQIRELADTVSATSSYALLRYMDNTVAAFDYMTGTLLFTDDTDREPIGLVAYARSYVARFKAGLKSDSAYNGASNLVSNLCADPIDDALTYRADGITDPGEVIDTDTDIVIDITDNVLAGTVLADGDNTAGGDNVTAGSVPSVSVELTDSVSQIPIEEAVNAGSDGSEIGSEPTDSIGQNSESTSVVAVVRDVISDSALTDSPVPTSVGLTDSVSQAGMNNATTVTVGDRASNSGLTDSVSHAGMNNATTVTAGERVLNSGTTDSVSQAGMNNATTVTAGDRALNSGMTDSVSQGTAGKSETTDTADSALGFTTTDSVGQYTGNGPADALNDSSVPSVPSVSAEMTDSVSQFPENGPADALTDSFISTSAEMTDSVSQVALNGAAAVAAGDSTLDSGLTDSVSQTSAISTSGRRDQDYVIMLKDAAEGYEIYRADDILLAGSAEPVSQNDKLRALEIAGIKRAGSGLLDELVIEDDTNRAGLVLIISAGAIILVLLMVLAVKKKVKSKRSVKSGE